MSLRKYALLAVTGTVVLYANVFPADARNYPTYKHTISQIFLDLQPKAAMPQGTVLRRVYDKGLSVTKLAEGWRSTLYNDPADYCTIGYGHLVKKTRCDGSEDQEFVRGVSKKRGTEILLTDMEVARWAVMSEVKVSLTDGQFAALCDFTFNVGVTNFRKSDLLTAVNENRFDAVYTQLMRWTLAGGKKIRGLRVRREREYELFFDGIPQLKAAPSVGEDIRPLDIRTGKPKDL